MSYQQTSTQDKWYWHVTYLSSWSRLSAVRQNWLMNVNWVHLTQHIIRHMTASHTQLMSTRCCSFTNLSVACLYRVRTTRKHQLQYNRCFAAQTTSPILCRCVSATVIRHGLVSARCPAATILFHRQELNLPTEPSLWPDGTVYQQQFVKLTACIRLGTSSKHICLLYVLMTD